MSPVSAAAWRVTLEGRAAGVRDEGSLGAELAVDARLRCCCALCRFINPRTDGGLRQLRTDAQWGFFRSSAY